MQKQEQKNLGRRWSSGSRSEATPSLVYKVQVATGKLWGSATFDSVSITLVGLKGESPKQLLDKTGKDFIHGAVDNYEILSDRDLGPLLLIRLHKEPYQFFPEDPWFCDFVQLTTPDGQIFHFPCYQWLEGYRTLELREGTGEIIQSIPKGGRLEIRLKGLMSYHESWKRLEHIRKIFWFNKTLVSEYVADHWEEDTFFGYQYLNGVNPVVIEKCTEIPANFPVTQEMVAESLGKSTTLSEELQKGNIFLVDYKILQGIPTNLINGEQQYLATPLCLFHQRSSGDLVPIAIQLSQVPSPENPIFLPSDPRWDWTLAKMWVRNADFHIHQNISHLLKTHLMAEIFTMATLRHLPMCHPVFKLLIPHQRYTLQINILARIRLIRKGGMMDQATSAGFEGIGTLVSRGVEQLTYSSLCLPEDIKARGVESVANYYYRDDASRLWAAIESFVAGFVRYYYWNDDRIRGDSELQAWIREIFKEAFQSQEASGAPSSLTTAEELTKFLTMVIFTCSVQHAAVNSGQRTLGFYPDRHFVEEEPKRLMEAFQTRLADISEQINQRNQALALPYDYLNPTCVENSVSI
ncbi:arachidonate 12-lipoxygenase, 12R-type-like [Protobothrops mucrosquamatus]|uniref:arachidonate 12-lipoxygenase, 12R-type-like n=1 Tax=Protobothrops mucrosquamatus TaxID=103944 RepID=UPI000775A04A|nr:arachidonate 12-lipoxygenase, 12R-type-like [Protobothrops mucrosquamatus]